MYITIIWCVAGMEKMRTNI